MKFFCQYLSNQSYYTGFTESVPITHLSEIWKLSYKIKLPQLCVYLILHIHRVPELPTKKFKTWVL